MVARRLQEQQQPRQRVSIPAENFGRYTGHYCVNDSRVLIITVEGGQLFAQITDEPRFKIFPESETKFFWTVVTARIEFYLDRNKRVSHAVLHQYGQLIPMTRLEDEDVAA
jgi:serine-type D-Ala-D-Ala carboxypeptidase/endopeptidase